MARDEQSDTPPDDHEAPDERARGADSAPERPVEEGASEAPYSPSAREAEPDVGTAAGDVALEAAAEEAPQTGSEARGAGAEEVAAAAAQASDAGPEVIEAAVPPEPESEQPSPEAVTAAADAAQPLPAGEQPEPAGDVLEPSAQELIEERAAEAVEPRADAAEAERRPRGKRSERGEPGDEDVIPGAHLDPDLVLEEQPTEEEKYAEYAEVVEAEQPEAELRPPPEPEPVEPLQEEVAAPATHTPRDLAADARYHATGKRKTSVARVTLSPGSGGYTINGRSLEEFFPRRTLRQAVREPLETAGYESRMDVVARIHGGGVSGQAGALRHGVARALTEADPQLRGDLKRRGFLTRDARAKERKKAGLKKARKRPQFSKR